MDGLVSFIRRTSPAASDSEQTKCKKLKTLHETLEKQSNLIIGHSDVLIDALQALDMSEHSLGACHLIYHILTLLHSNRISFPQAAHTSGNISAIFDVICLFFLNIQEDQLVYSAKMFTNVATYANKLFVDSNRGIELVAPLCHACRLWRVSEHNITSVDLQFLYLCSSLNLPQRACSLTDSPKYDFDEGKMFGLEDMFVYFILAARNYCELKRWRKAECMLHFVLTCPCIGNARIKQKLSDAQKMFILVHFIRHGTAPNFDHKKFEHLQIETEALKNSNWFQLVFSINRRENRAVIFERLECIANDLSNLQLSSLAQECLESMEQREVISLTSCFYKVPLSFLTGRLQVDSIRAAVVLLRGYKDKGWIDFELDENTGIVTFLEKDLKGAEIMSELWGCRENSANTAALNQQYQQIQFAAEALIKMQRKIQTSDVAIKRVISKYPRGLSEAAVDEGSMIIAQGRRQHLLSDSD